MKEALGIIGVITFIGIITLNILSVNLVFNPPKMDHLYHKHIEFIKKKKMKLFTIKGGKINISVLHIEPKKLRSNKLIVFSHGNGSDIFEYAEYLYKLSNTYGARVVCYDYCGYGLTLGEKTEQNCTKCLEAVVNFYGNDYIILFGYSLGSGVTINFAHKHNWKNPIVLIAPFKTIARVLFDSVWIDSINFFYPFLTIKKLDKIKCPIKIIHGKDDKLIPFTHGVELHKNLSDKTYDIKIVDGCDHQGILYNLLDPDESIEKILSN